MGLITSSLGGHGDATNDCNDQDPGFNPTDNDHGHLLPKVRQNLSSYTFLNFDGTNGTTLAAQFADQVDAAGEQGCGFESSLEAWYRFLVDPAPPLNVKVTNGVSSPDGVDHEVLTERASFLRPDSLLAIVMLTDENDCSVMDSGLGWVALQPNHMPRATSACATDPNSSCCRSCALQESSAPSGCQPINTDPSCTKGPFTDKEDAPNLRCFDQKRRFGVDLLYPTQRYVNALTQLEICPNEPDLTCQKGDTPKANPIYSDLNQSGKVPRDPSLVYLAAITGVPWQDIATNNTLKVPTALEFKTAEQLSTDGIWDDIVGDVNKHIPPKDPLMQESIDPRSGSNPRTGDSIAAPSAGANANPINGHEYDVLDRDDLQFACIFPLATPQPNSLDCANVAASPNNPLCQNPSNGQYGTTQYFAKAYPGLRQLQVLKDFGSNSIVASICPKVLTSDPGDPAFEYNPAVTAIVSRLKAGFNAPCLPQSLPLDSKTGRVSCQVVEALPSSSPKAYDCSKKPGRAPLTGASGVKLEAAVRANLQQSFECDGTGQPACADFQMCLISQLDSQTDLHSCLNDAPVASGVNGFCYIDGNCVGNKTCNGAFIAHCPDNEKQQLRFVGGLVQTPTPGARVFISCTPP